MRRVAAVVGAAGLLGGCGDSGYHGPKLPHAVAQRLLAALGSPATVQAETIRDINARRIPAELQEPLLSQVNALLAQPTDDRRNDLERWLRERAG